MLQSNRTPKSSRILTPVRLVICLLVLAIALTGWQLHSAANLATKGEYMGLIESRVRTLKAQNLRLKEEILQRQSLTYLINQASSLGFIPTSEFVYLPASSTVVAALVVQP